MAAFGQSGFAAGYGSQRRQNSLRSMGQMDQFGGQVRSLLQPQQTQPQQNQSQQTPYAAYAPQQQAPSQSQYASPAPGVASSPSLWQAGQDQLSKKSQALGRPSTDRMASLLDSRPQYLRVDPERAWMGVQKLDWSREAAAREREQQYRDLLAERNRERVAFGEGIDGPNAGWRQLADSQTQEAAASGAYSRLVYALSRPQHEVDAMYDRLMGMQSTKNERQRTEIERLLAGR